MQNSASSIDLQLNQTDSVFHKKTGGENIVYSTGSRLTSRNSHGDLAPMT